jgi:hypothetical protein
MKSMKFLGEQGVHSITMRRKSETKNFARFEKSRGEADEVGGSFGTFYLPLATAKDIQTITVIVNRKG